jgi:hypothetical protein
VGIASSPCRFVLVVLLALFACGGGASESSDSSSGDDTARKEKPVAEQGKQWSGWRWKGKRDDCFFLVENECHATLAAACKAAGCGKSSCVQDDSAPVKVSCEK